MKLRFTGLLALVCGLSVVQAGEIYRSVDADGNVTFSDQPTPDAKPVKLPPLPTYVPAEIVTPEEAVAETPTEVTSYEVFTITSPKNQETIYADTGAVQVAFSVKPELDVAAGHRIVVELDGKAQGAGVASSSVSIENVDRGTHRVSARLVDKTGKTMARSGSATIFVKRYSQNSQNTDDTQGKPPGKPGDKTVISNPGSRSSNPNVRTENPNVMSKNPNVRSANPNVISENPNVRTQNPNILTPQTPATPAQP